jgi:hypothetical protein
MQRIELNWVELLKCFGIVVRFLGEFKYTAFLYSMSSRYITDVGPWVSILTWSLVLLNDPFSRNLIHIELWMLFKSDFAIKTQIYPTGNRTFSLYLLGFMSLSQRPDRLWKLQNLSCKEYSTTVVISWGGGGGGAAPAPCGNQSTNHHNCSAEVSKAWICTSIMAYMWAG